MNDLKDDFDKMMQLAEYGASRHNDRRQIEFRIFISYVTLLLLGMYQIDKLKPLVESSGESLFWIVLLLGILHFVYLLWEIRLSIANENDGSRRNLYLKKAECLLYHLRENHQQPFYPSNQREITYSFGDKVDKGSRCSKKEKIYESELFRESEPTIVLVPRPWQVHRYWGQLLSDWSRPFQTWIPTGLLLLFIFQLVNKSSTSFPRRYIWISIVISLLLLIGFPLLDKGISMLVKWVKRRVMM